MPSFTVSASSRLLRWTGACTRRGVDDLAAACQIALRQQLLPDLLEYLVAYAGPRQAITEQPDRLGVRDANAFSQVQETQEAAAAQQLILRRVIGQIVQLLQYQDLDYQDRRVRRTAALGTRRRGAATSILAASASKSTCPARPTYGSLNHARRSSRFCSANRLIRGLIMTTHAGWVQCQRTPHFHARNCFILRLLMEQPYSFALLAIHERQPKDAPSTPFNQAQTSEKF